MDTQLTDSGAVPPLLPLFLSVFPAYSLEIADLGQRSIFRFREEAFGGSMQHGQLVTKELGTRFGNCLNQAFEHGTQTPRNLNALGAKVTDFCNGQVNEILPVGRPVDESKPAGGISYVSRIQISIT
jgi:hypothetical protein